MLARDLFPVDAAWSFGCNPGMSMLAGEVLARFEKQTPLTVQSRALLEYALAPEKLNALFRSTAASQYERELLFSTTVDVMTEVVLKARSSVRQSYLEKEKRGEISVSLAALYAKLQLTEVGTSEALVCHSFRQLHPVLVAMKGLLPSWHDKFEVKIIDGNCLAATQHRLEVLRRTSAGPLPGKGLVIYDVQSDLIQDCILCQDGHAQERSLFERWYDQLRAGQLWIDDRNFCTAEALFTIHDADARFITRQHASNAPWQEAGEKTCVGRIDTGVVYEQPVLLLREDPKTKEKRTLSARRVTIVLDEATRDGEQELHLLTDLTAEELDGGGVSSMYRQRWTIENAFLHLTMDLNSEIDTLGYPGAALFGLAVGMVAYNMVSAMKASVRAEYGQEAVEQLSGYSISQDIAVTSGGMVIALPAETWLPIATWTAEQMGLYLLSLAKMIVLKRFKKTTRGPKKPAPKKTATKKGGHVSTAQLLAARNNPGKKSP